MEIYLIPGVCFACAVAVTPIAGRLARAFHAISEPDGVRRLHAQPTPLWGGVGVCFGLLVGIFLSGAAIGGSPGATSLPLGLGLSASILCALGLIDDRTALSAWAKLAGQLVASLPVVLAGLAVERVTFLGCEIGLGWFGVPWTIGWLLLGMNAMNLLDGSDGLASTIGVLASLGIAGISLLQGRTEVALMALSLAGAVGAFLVYNRPTARIYLGDGGSTIIGLALALLAQQASLVGAATANLTVMGLLLFVPLLDTGLAIARRALKGQAILVGDRGHLHHQLQDQGFSAWGIMLVAGSLCVVSGGAAWSAMVWGRGLWAWLALSVITGLLVYAGLVAREEWSLLRLTVWQAAGALRRGSRESAIGRLRVFNPDAGDAMGETPLPVGGNAAEGASQRRAA